MHPYQIAYAVANDDGLMNRIRGLLSVKAPNATPTERRLIESTSTETFLAGVVAGNAAIVSVVTAAIEASPGLGVSAAIAEVTDADIEFVVLQELTFLQT